MWEKVRVQGGAYGGFCRLRPLLRACSLCLSYRDPNLLETLAIYDQTADFLRGLDLPAERADQVDHRRDRRAGRLPAARMPRATPPWCAT